LKVEDVAKALGKSPQVIRICLQQGLLPFGTAIKMPKSSKYTYIIYSKKFEEYIKK
jgi:hypothetical protein